MEVPIDKCLASSIFSKVVFLALKWTQQWHSVVKEMEAFEFMTRKAASICLFWGKVVGGGGQKYSEHFWEQRQNTAPRPLFAFLKQLLFPLLSFHASDFFLMMHLT